MDQGEDSERPLTSLSESKASRQVKSPFVSRSEGPWCWSLVTQLKGESQQTCSEG